MARSSSTYEMAIVVVAACLAAAASLHTSHAFVLPSPTSSSCVTQSNNALPLPYSPINTVKSSSTTLLMSSSSPTTSTNNTLSLQLEKPLGLILEEADDTNNPNNSGVIITQIKGARGGDNARRSKPLSKKIIDALKVAPAVASLPLYGITFAVFGPKHVWLFSKWIYGQANPSNYVLAAHFDRMTAYLYSGKKIASQKLVSYKIHPLFAGLSMISTALLAFVDRASYCKFLTYQQLLLLNTIICFVSALAAFPLSKLMIGNLHAKKWIVIQGKLSILYAALAFCPGTVGRVMVHLNWALLFASGAIERIWILCIMTQLDIPDRKTFLKFYSPQMKVAAIGGIPLGLVTYFFRR
mmetsp:Transcript_14733/g.24103  ORF Transcript_14733/g.24103 Transcript_14733/m.24103 type:complete len:354 (-) Transcript_14733:1148-2209(-)